MENIETRLAHLFSKKEWTSEEHEWFLELLQTKSPAELQQYFAGDYLANLSKGHAGNNQMAQALLQQIHHKTGMKTEEAPVVPLMPANKWWRVAAVAVMVVTLGLIYTMIPNRKDEPAISRNQPSATDVKAPVSNRAMITLADGNTVYLDSINSGHLVVQDHVKLVKLASGEIVYKTESGETIKEIQYNTLFNPRGSQVATISLSDGTRVWLNAGSALTYPVAFTSNERKVSITGEAYFEVTTSFSSQSGGQKRPFKVEANGVVTEVLGTHFNVNSYADEPDVKVTLLEGAVRINKNNASELLSPGEQAQVSSNIKIVKDVDLEEIMAWKNGRFQFGGVGIEEIMRQVSRWYDVEVIYEGKPMDQHFRGSIQREEEVSELFKMLEATGVIHFKIEGKRITVTP
ncbi:FecR domain-containing protein [Chitinophagaceae bacterium LB-8]|uniref:FecR domain-containing protein n=1 Tax=Paraflavisolibacter caeni TaxID=2982496 RepID=A0A9X3BKA6_9BACT|nr:FecR family protein [Paraflavisolibacter caeni]MCU7552563.1 FecR domain-containing protein [Paraflavisolibacter caeni]